MATLPPTLVSGALLLRRLHPTHCDDVLAAVRRSLPELGAWFGWAHSGYDRDAAATFVAEQWLAWERGRSYQFVITRDAAPEVLGMCGLDEISPVRRSANLGYWVRSDVAGQGLATAAARMVARFGFEHAGLERLELFCAEGNDASRRVAEKVGFAYEGRMRQHLEIGGARVDSLLYGLTSVDVIPPV